MVTNVCLTWSPLVSQELPLTLPLASAGTVTSLPATALFVLIVEAARVEVPRALPDGEQVTGPFTLVNSKLPRCVLNALPLLQKPTGEELRIRIQVLFIKDCSFRNAPPPFKEALSIL